MNNPGVVVPPVPEKSALNRFDEQFVRQRRLALEKCIQKIANHPVLCKDSDLKLFLESDTFSLDVSSFLFDRSLIHLVLRLNIGKRNLHTNGEELWLLSDKVLQDPVSTRQTKYVTKVVFLHKSCDILQVV